MASGLPFTDHATGATGYLWPIGWTPQIVPKRKFLTTPDLDAQAHKAEAKDGGRRGHIVVQGIPIAIENPAGSVRSGMDPAGNRWAVTMRHHYGFCKRTVGADGDGVDCFVGPDPESYRVFIINQTDPTSGNFDEHKVMLGWNSQKEAKAAYHANYSAGWAGYESMVEHTMDDFKDWLSDETATRSLAKAHGDYPPLQPGDHFISMGHGGEKHTFLIHMVPGSNHVARVIGGGGGKLNGLRLNKLDPAKWKENSKASAKTRRDAEAKRKASLTPEEREKENGANAEGKAARHEAEKQFIKDTLGNGQNEEQPDLFEEAKKTPEEEKANHRALLKEAKRVAAETEKKVMLDAEARGASGLSLLGGDAPVDLDQILTETQGKGGPGYDPKLAERAKSNGLTTEKMMAQVAEIKAAAGKTPKEPGPIDPAQQAANIELHKATKELAAKKAAAYYDAAKATLEANQDYAKILQARNTLRQVYKEQLAKKKGITFEPGYQMAVGEPGEHEALVQSLHQQLLTGHVRGFLEEVDEKFPDGSDVDPFKANEFEGMHQSRGAGAFDLLHDVGLAALGQGVIDRDVVECLGPEGAAQVVARAIRKNFGQEDQKAVLEALEHHHIEEQEKVLPQVTEDAKALRAQAAEYDQELVGMAHDLPTAMEIQKNKIGALKEARRMLGGQLGRMEARAALIASLHDTPRTEYAMPLGKMAPEKAVMTAAALGMPEGTYTIEHEDGEAVLTAKGAAMDALVKPVDATANAEREVALSIKSGSLDEPDFLPKGFANRLADRYSNDTLEPSEFQRHHDVQDGDDPEAVKGKLQAWMGAKLADGERPEDIVAHAYGGAKLGLSPEAQERWLASLQEMVPLRVTAKDEQGNPIPEIDKATGKPIVANGKPMYKTRMRAPHEVAASLEPMMQSYMAANPKEAGTTLQGQRVDDTPDFHEAVHRALAEDPRLAAAYVPQGELGHEHASAIRDFFYKEHFGGKANSDEAKHWKFDQAVEALGPEPQELHPEAAAVGMFAGLSDEDMGEAEGAKSDKWVEWNNKRQALEAQYHEDASKPTLWEQYIKRMGGTKFAQGAIQDVMRGKLNDSFHAHYEGITGKVLQMAKTDIAGAQEHLKMTLGEKEAGELEASRKAQQAKLQKKGGSKFQAGTVGDKLKDAKAAQALAQAEGGSLFDESETEEPGPDKMWERPELAPGERYHLGTALENQLRSVMPAAAEPFAGRKGAVKVDTGIHMSGKYSTQQRAVKAITQLKRIGLFYGAGCVYGGTMLKCAKLGVTRSFYEWWLTGERPWVESMGRDGMEVIQASPVFVKGFEEMVKVALSNGAEMIVTPGHRFLGLDGWTHAGDLSVGDSVVGAGDGQETVLDPMLDTITEAVLSHREDAQVPAWPVRPDPPGSTHGEGYRHSPIVSPASLWPFLAVHRSILAGDGQCSQRRFGPSLPPTSLGIGQPTHGEDDLSFAHKLPGSLEHYSRGTRLDDERLRSEEGGAQEFVTSQVDAHGHSLPNWPSGGQEYGLAHTRACRESSPRATPHFYPHCTRKRPASGPQAASGGSAHSRDTYRSSPQSSGIQDLAPGIDQEVLDLKSGMSLDDPFSFVTIISVKKMVAFAVFDISVPATNNYIANGIVNHNSGKSGIMLGALSELHQSGKCKKSILAVPSVVQGQFGSEAIKFLDPTSGFHVHAQPGESYEERLAAYRDPDKHAVVVTHQTLRDDTLKILGDHLGGGAEGAREFLLKTPPKEAAAAVKEAFTKAGIDFSALMVDEAHGGLDRDGKADSTLSKVLDAHSHNSEHVVMATGDPLKNDVSEIWSNLNKIDPHKYGADTRDEFMRRYKNDAPLAKKSMAQELSRYWFNGRVDVGKECFRSNPSVALTDKQQAAVAQIDLASGKLRTGAPDTLKWAKILAPKSFENMPESEHAKIAERVAKAAGTMREAAMNRVINLDPDGGKMAEHVRIAKERVAEGKPCVIFAHSLEAVAAIHAKMGEAGLKSVSLTGEDTTKDKASKAAKFQDGHADVIVLSDAGATGLNLQRGKCIINHDLPATAMCHNQRIARIHRLGQTDNVESITLQADHAWERNNWERVKRKGVLGEIFQDPSGYLDDHGLAGDLKAIRARAGQGKKEGAA